MLVGVARMRLVLATKTHRSRLTQKRIDTPLISRSSMHTTQSFAKSAPVTFTIDPEGEVNLFSVQHATASNTHMLVRTIPLYLQKYTQLLMDGFPLVLQRTVPATDVPELWQWFRGSPESGEAGTP
jgi:hypothetical protein